MKPLRGPSECATASPSSSRLCPCCAASASATSVGFSGRQVAFDPLFCAMELKTRFEGQVNTTATIGASYHRVCDFPNLRCLHYLQDESELTLKSPHHLAPPWVLPKAGSSLSEHRRSRSGRGLAPREPARLRRRVRGARRNEGAVRFRGLMRLRRGGWRCSVLPGASECVRWCEGFVVRVCGEESLTPHLGPVFPSVPRRNSPRTDRIQRTSSRTVAQASIKRCIMSSSAQAFLKST